MKTNEMKVVRVAMLAGMFAVQAGLLFAEGAAFADPTVNYVKAACEVQAPEGGFPAVAAPVPKPKPADPTLNYLTSSCDDLSWKDKLEEAAGASLAAAGAKTPEDAAHLANVAQSKLDGTKVLPALPVVASTATAKPVNTPSLIAPSIPVPGTTATARWTEGRKHHDSHKTSLAAKAGVGAILGYALGVLALGIFGGPIGVALGGLVIGGIVGAAVGAIE